MGLDSFPSKYIQVAVTGPSTLLYSPFSLGPRETKKNVDSRIIDGKNFSVDILRHCISLRKGLMGGKPHTSS